MLNTSKSKLPVRRHILCVDTFENCITKQQSAYNVPVWRYILNYFVLYLFLFYFIY